MPQDQFNQFFAKKEYLIEALSKNALLITPEEDIETIASYLFSEIQDNNKITKVIRIFKENFPIQYGNAPHTPLLEATEKFIETSEFAKRKTSLAVHAVEALKWICVDMVIYK